MDRTDDHRQRYVVLDSYRFLAAFGIVLYHFNAHFSVFRPPQPDALDRFQTLVDFFFVLSGFVMMHTYGSSLRDLRSYGDFLRKRLARIYPLHLATILVCIAIYLAIQATKYPMQDTSLVDMRVLPANLMLVHAWGFTDQMGLNGPSWSISAEAFVYILFPCLALVVIRWRPAAGLGLAMLIVVLVEVSRWSLGLRPESVATFDFGMLRALPMFLAGLCVYELVSRASRRPLSWFVPYGLSCAIVCLMLLRVPLLAIDLLYPALVATIALAEQGRRPTMLRNPVFIRLGEASFAIYMLHTFVAIACVRLVHATGWTSPAALVSIAVGGTAVILLVGVLSFHYFETPMRRWLGGPKRTARASVLLSVPALRPRLEA